MKTLIFLMLVLPPSWGAPLLEGRGSEQELPDEGVHNHTDPYSRGARLFSLNQFDLGDIAVEGRVIGEKEVSIGHNVGVSIEESSWAAGEDSTVARGEESPVDVDEESPSDDDEEFHSHADEETHVERDEESLAAPHGSAPKDYSAKGLKELCIEKCGDAKEVCIGNKCRVANDLCIRMHCEDAREQCVGKKCGVQDAKDLCKKEQCGDAKDLDHCMKKLCRASYAKTLCIRRQCGEAEAKDHCIKKECGDTIDHCIRKQCEETKELCIKEQCGNAKDLCIGKKCGDVCDEKMLRYCQHDGSCGINPHPFCKAPPSLPAAESSCTRTKSDSSGTTSASNCCTVSSPCQVNQGHCENDSECAGSSVCGSKNCRSIKADCCKPSECDPTTFQNLPIQKKREKREKIYKSMDVSTPFGGTVHPFPNTSPHHPTSKLNLRKIHYVGQFKRRMWDYREEGFIEVQAFVFQMYYVDNQEVPLEVRVNPEFGKMELARAEAVKYAKIIGQSPLEFRVRLKFLDLNEGTLSDGGSGGGSYEGKSMTLNTGYGQDMIKKGTIHNFFLHEGSHVSIDNLHKYTGEWICAQNDDGKFISNYARDNPDREDMAESITAWYLLTFQPNDLAKEDRKKIEETIPNRLKYFTEYIRIMLDEYMYDN